MSLRLSAQRFYFRLWIYLLPLISVGLATYIRFYTRLLPRVAVDYAPRLYVGVALFTTMAWILVSEQNANITLAHADIGHVMESGAITLSGAATALRDDDRVREAYLGL